MSNLTLNQTFQEKLQDRIRESFGDLISDEELKQLIERGIEELLFKERVDTASRGYNTNHNPPLITEMIQKTISKQVEAAVKVWVTENSDVIAAHLRTVLEQGVGTSVMRAFNNMFQNDFYTFTSNLEQRLQNGGL